MLSISLLVLGAFIMLYGIIKYYKALIELKKQTKSQNLFSNAIYLACFAMMLFFLAGYVFTAVVYVLEESITSQDFLIALIFFLGAIFVVAMVTMVQRMFIAISDKAELTKQLKQQELMSAISQSFTTTENMDNLINNALKTVGEFLGVNHTFISRYLEDKGILECNYEWYDKKARPFLGDEDKWPISPDMEIYQDLTTRGYAAISDYASLSHPNFQKVKNYRLGAFLNIPIELSGKFWGILGFIYYEKTYNWEKSNINLGIQIASIFSGAIQRNKVDEELLYAKELAELGNKSKSEFLSRMSHEIRTPMNAIIGMTNIGKSAKDMERINYCLEKIEGASTHLLGLINDILDMSKIEANKLELSSVEMDLDTMLKNVVDVVSYQMGEKKQQFVLSVDPGVPKKIISDEQRLRQVITNLLSNAVKFTPDNGSISLFVRMFEAEKENEKCILRFEVKDTGIGMTPEQQSHLFKPFTQADGSISRKYGGTGLGLAISKSIVELMNGNIYTKSAKGQGTSFIFTIQIKIPDPRSKGDADADDKAANTANPYPNGCFKHLKILIAEDIEINREIVAALLEFTGITIDFAEDGNIALKLFSADPSAYNMVFMDVHMPETDGFEATKKIRELDNPQARTIPIVAMTADVFHEDIEKCLKAGMNDHVGKPLEIESVLKKISMYCA